MKIKKLKKIKIKKLKKQNKTMIKKINKQKITNWGGFLVNPPKTCKFKRKCIEDNGIWVDLGCCQHNCKEQCDLYIWFKKAKSNERKEYLLKNNVIIKE